jgi:hypothetical protein
MQRWTASLSEAPPLDADGQLSRALHALVHRWIFDRQVDQAAFAAFVISLCHYAKSPRYHLIRGRQCDVFECLGAIYDLLHQTDCVLAPDFIQSHEMIGSAFSGSVGNDKRTLGLECHASSQLFVL